MKSNKIDDPLESKYVQLWLRTKVNFPFIFVVDLLRKKWDVTKKLTKKGSYEKANELHTAFWFSLKQKNDKWLRSKEMEPFFPILQAVLSLDKSDSYKRKVMMAILSDIPSSKYTTDIEKLMFLFEFEKEWLYSLSYYVVTDKIWVPRDLITTKQFPEKIREMVGVFTIDLLKVMGNKDYEDFTYMQIGELLFGDNTDGLNLTDQELRLYDSRLKDRIEKYRSRFREKDYYLPLTKEIADQLTKKFS